MVFVMGILIMYASLLSSLKERLQESAMVQILGANKRFVAKVLAVEFGVLGVLAGLVASVMAQIIAQDLASHFFGLVYVFDFTLFGLSIGACTIAITVFGLFGARAVFKVSPLWLLRQTG
jgi:putative ABC transport system permease protein